MKPYRLSAQDLKDISLYHLNRKIRFVYFFLAITLIFMALNAAKESNQLLVYLLGYGVMYLGAILAIQKILVFKVNQSVQRVERLEEPIQIKFNDQEIVWESPQDQVMVKWSDIKDVREGEKWIFLTLSKMINHTVPLSAFEDQKELNLFRQYVYQ